MIFDIGASGALFFGDGDREEVITAIRAFLFLGGGLPFLLRLLLVEKLIRLVDEPSHCEDFKIGCTRSITTLYFNDCYQCSHVFVFRLLSQI